jgi:hypothetical protein
MIDEEDNQDDQPGNNSFSGLTLNKVVAIMFVLGIYLIIFLKILVLE